MKIPMTLALSSTIQKKKLGYKENKNWLNNKRIVLLDFWMMELKQVQLPVASLNQACKQSRQSTKETTSLRSSRLIRINSILSLLIKLKLLSKVQSWMKQVRLLKNNKTRKTCLMKTIVILSKTNLMKKKMFQMVKFGMMKKIQFNKNKRKT